MMKTLRYLPYITAFVFIAWLTQYLLIAFVPDIVFAVGKARSQQALNTVIHAPPTDAGLRQVVLPNPDFVYSACFYDVSDHDLIISGTFPDTSRYCSLAFYGDNLQPYYVMNNLQGFKKDYEVRLSHVRHVNRTVKAATKQGALLMRILVTDTAQLHSAQQLQQRFKVRTQPQND